jgi:hypothetical protein
MNNFDIRLSKLFDPSDMLEILSEDEVVVAPVRIVAPMSRLDRETIPISPDDFEKSYSNETGNTGLPRLVVSVIAPSHSYDSIRGPHYIPFYMGGVLASKSSGFHKISAKHELMVAVENLSMMLTVMGREVFLPLAPIEEDTKIEDIKINAAFENKINLSLVNADILPGHWCYPYKPGQQLPYVECVYPEKVREERENFTDPITDTAAIDAISRKAEDDRKSPRGVNELIDLHKRGIISRETVIQAINKETLFDGENMVKRWEDFRAKTKEKCPDCKSSTVGKCEGCTMVKGRRGWRELGEYDS